jgi:hypothetical protein
MIGREELQLTKEKAEDILYAGDAPFNEASMHKLLSDTALAICFRLLDTDKHFVCKFHPPLPGAPEPRFRPIRHPQVGVVPCPTGGPV